jgi:hypothetical protein
MAADIEEHRNVEIELYGTKNYEMARIRTHTTKQNTQTRTNIAVNFSK